MTINHDGPAGVTTETTLREDVLHIRKGETQWETRAARKARKRVRNSTTKNRNKSQKISLISNPKESLDRKTATPPC